MEPLTTVGTELLSTRPPGAELSHGVQKRSKKLRHQAGALGKFSQHARFGLSHDSPPISGDCHAIGTDVHFSCGAPSGSGFLDWGELICPCQSGALVYRHSLKYWSRERERLKVTQGRARSDEKGVIVCPER